MYENRFTLPGSGRVIIPATYRKELELDEGEDMVMRLIDGEIHIYSIKHALEKARATVSKYVDDSVSLLDELYKMRRSEVENERAGK
ncbi:hypothetical protein BH10BAC2_BH10BAC2_26920 [soil metagenome]